MGRRNSKLVLVTLICFLLCLLHLFVRFLPVVRYIEGPYMYVQKFNPIPKFVPQRQQSEPGVTKVDPIPKLIPERQQSEPGVTKLDRIPKFIPQPQTSSLLGDKTAPPASAILTVTPMTTAWVQSSTRRIPRILHQTWINDSIPHTYVLSVRSWLAHHPKLSYYYWTDANSVEFVAKYYPHLLAMFKGYKMHLNRADAIRYMLLHHYGGIYADMDVMRLKNLSPLLSSSRELCYLSQERYEISRLYWGRNSSVMNAVMLSWPGHKFMEYVVNALPRYANQSPNVMKSTGPFFLQNVYNEFMRSPPCSLSDPTCRCLASDPYMFMPQIDPIRIPMFQQKCAKPGIASNVREACDMLNKIRWQNSVAKIGRNSYTHHGFLHYGFQNQKLHFDYMFDINSIRKDKLSFGVDFF